MERQAVAEDLRRQGNDAFGTQDWERANTLYEQSIETFPTAKAYANQAATLCKLGRYPEASHAAERATDMDPRWAKGWWRRGTTAEVRKQFANALMYYEMAVQLAPKEKTFRTSHKAMQQRLKVRGKTDDGRNIVGLPDSGDPNSTNPAFKAFWKARQAMGENEPLGATVKTMEDLEVEAVGGDGSKVVPTSLQYLVAGMGEWVLGLHGAIASFCTSINREADEALQELHNRPWSSQREFLLEAERLVGGYPSDAATLASGITHLHGQYIILEVGNRRSPREYMCPQPRFLSGYPAYQSLAVTHSMAVMYRGLIRRYGFSRDLVCGRAVMFATMMYHQQMGLPCTYLPLNLNQDPTPQEAVDYMKAQLRAGKTWDRGIRQYASVHYRCTLLFSYMMSLMGQFAQAYEMGDWAHQFINLADEEFQVSETGSYKEKGTAFLPSFRIGFLVGKVRLHGGLRGDGSPEYSLRREMTMCREIIELAEKVKTQEELGTEYVRLQQHVAFYRKPLAFAHSVIGAHLSFIGGSFPLHLFKKAAAAQGFIDNEDDDCDPFAMIAEHYHLAAKNELPDAAEGAIFWWAYASNMARASLQSGYTLGELRHAIKMAQEAEDSRDTYLFGPNIQGTHSAVAKFTALHFRDEGDSFILPQVKINHEIPGKSTLEIDGIVICSDFEKFEQVDRDARKHPYDEFMDTKKVTKEHGQANIEVPSLETLCIRALHKEGCEFAKGETDGAVIIGKAMMASSTST